MQDGRLASRKSESSTSPCACGTGAKLPASCPAMPSRRRCPLRTTAATGSKPKVYFNHLPRRERQHVLAPEGMVRHLQVVDGLFSGDLAVDQAQLPSVR